MADYRLSAKIIGRSSGRSSVAAAAYRAGAQLDDQRTGLHHDYTRKNGVLHSEILTPDNAPDWMKDRATLWNAVEAVERRKDAQLAREIQLSLPHELDESQNRYLVLGFIQSHFVDRGMIADLAIHAPDSGGDQRNIHAHVMLTTRVLTGDGFGKKNRQWNTPEQLKTWREAWADHQNEVFRELAMEQRVDHRSYAEQGVEREPTQHLGTVANDMEKKGKASRIGNENRLRQQRNAERAALAQQSAETSRNLAAEKVRQDEIENAAKAAQQSRYLDDQIEMGRRHALQANRLDADLHKRNDERRQQLDAEQRWLEQQLQADGWRKLMRDFTGKTRRDNEQLLATRKNLEDIQMRESSERQALAFKQDAERQNLNVIQEQRKTSYAQQLDQNKQAALERSSVGKRGPAHPEPSNDRLNPSWERAQAVEQDNQPEQVQNFNRAAVAAPVVEQTVSVEQNLEARKQYVRDQMRNMQDRGNDRGGMDRD